jgi:hypothetical protein
VSKGLRYVEDLKLTLLLFAAALSLNAQITIDTFAGGAVRSGVPAQSVFLDSVNGLAWDAAGLVVFCDQTNQAIRRVPTRAVRAWARGSTRTAGSTPLRTRPPAVPPSLCTAPAWARSSCRALLWGLSTGP